MAFLALAVTLTGCGAFTPARGAAQMRGTVRRSMTTTMSSPGPAIAKPKVSIGQRTAQPGAPQKGKVEVEKVTRTSDPGNETNPMYKVILQDDNVYTKEHIVKNLKRIVGIDEKTAADVYVGCKTDGQAIACITTQETAEHYVEQLSRCSPMIFAEYEED